MEVADRLGKGGEGMIVRIVTLTGRGHEIKKRKLELLTEEKVFEMPYHIFVNGEVAETWEELLEVCKNSSVEEPEILRIPAMTGGR